MISQLKHQIIIIIINEKQKPKTLSLSITKKLQAQNTSGKTLSKRELSAISNFPDYDTLKFIYLRSGMYRVTSSGDKIDMY